MFKIVRVDQHGKEHGQPIYTDSKSNAAFMFGFSKGGDYVEHYTTRPKEGGKAKHEALIIETKVFHCDKYGNAKDITPGPHDKMEEAFSVDDVD